MEKILEKYLTDLDSVNIDGQIGIKEAVPKTEGTIHVEYTGIWKHIENELSYDYYVEKHKGADKSLAILTPKKLNS